MRGDIAAILPLAISGKIYSRIEDAMNGKRLDLRHAWIRCYQPRPYARVQLVCFPPEGASASFYRAWCARLPSTVELLAVQYPGREDRLHEDCIGDVHLLAERAADALGLVSQRTLVLFGHSLGAALAFEVALRLEERVAAPAVQLFVSGRSPFREPAKALQSVPDDALWADLYRLGGNAEAAMTDPDLGAMMLPILRSDYRISASYQPGSKAKLHGPIAAYVGAEDTKVTMDQARCWSNLTHGNFHARSFPGDHFYLKANPGMVIAELLKSLRLVDKNPAVWPARP